MNDGGIEDDIRPVRSTNPETSTSVAGSPEVTSSIFTDMYGAVGHRSRPVRMPDDHPSGARGAQAGARPHASRRRSMDRHREWISGASLLDRNLGKARHEDLQTHGLVKR